MRRPAWWWPALVLVALNWWLSSSAALTPLLGGLVHLLLYAALGFSLGRASGSYPAGWVLAAWLGAIDEAHQAFVAGQDAGISGWWVDLLGAFVGSRLSLRGSAESARLRRAGR